MAKLKKGTIMPCNQKQCGFLIAGRGCKKCASCGAKQYEVNELCETCFNCEYREGELRWGEEAKQKAKDKKAQKKEEKIIMPPIAQ